MPRCGQLQLARLVAIGAGEAALDVAEQLRFEQRLGQAGAVDRDERARGAGRVHVDLAGDEVLADAALAGDQDLGVAGRHAPRERAGCRASAGWRCTMIGALSCGASTGLSAIGPDA